MVLSRELAFTQLKNPLPKVWEQIPDEDWRLLAKKIRAANGRVIIAVHPHILGPNSTNYGSSISKLVSQFHTPVIILAEDSFFSMTREWLDKLKAPPHLTVPTQDSYPYVSLSTGVDSTHALLFDKIRGAGASTILVAGEETNCHWLGDPEGGSKVVEQEKKWLGERGKHLNSAVWAGCAGSLYREFVTSPITGGMKIRLVPAAVWPEKPPYFRDVRIRQALVKNRGLISRIRRKPNH